MDRGGWGRLIPGYPMPVSLLTIVRKKLTEITETIPRKTERHVLISKVAACR